MTNFDSFYNKVVNYKLGHLLNPRVVNLRSLVFPRNSVLLMPVNSTVANLPEDGKDMLLLNNDSLVFPLTELVAPIGKVRPSSTKVNKIITKYKRDNQHIKYYDISKLDKIKPNKLGVITTGLLNITNRYIITKDLEYVQWHNVMMTMLSFIASNQLEDKHLFLTIDLMEEPPNYSLLLRYNKLTKTKLGELGDDELFNTIMLINSIFKDTIEDSIFNKSGLLDNMGDVIVVFKHNDKGTLVKLKDIIGMSEDNNVESAFKTKSAPVTAKILLAMNRLLIESSMASVDDLKDDPVEEKGLVEKVSAIIKDTDKVDDAAEDIISKIKETSDSNSEEDNKLAALANEGKITKGTFEAIREIRKDQAKRKLKSKVSITNDDLKPVEKHIIDKTMILDKSMVSDNVGDIEKHYIKDVLPKHIDTNIFSLQNSGIFVKDIIKTDHKSILGESTEYEIPYISTENKRGTLKFTMPKVSDDGTFKIGGNEYRLRKQKADAPIRKIDATHVSLTSQYGKLLIEKGRLGKDNIGVWLSKEIISKVGTHNLKMVIKGSDQVVDTELPWIYTIISREILNFNLNNIYFTFKYHDRTSLAPDIDLKPLEKGGKVLCGKAGKKLYFMGKDGTMFEYISSFKEVKGILDILDIDIKQGPLEFPTLRLFRKNIPLCLVLMSYYGLDKTANLLKFKYRIIHNKKDVLPYESSIEFADGVMVFSKDITVANVMMSGLTAVQKRLEDVSIHDMNDASTIKNIMNTIGCNRNHMIELELLKDMFLDEYTKKLLEQLKEPSKFDELLIRASELLLTDYHNHTNDFRNMVVKGYDRLAGMLYFKMVEAIRNSKRNSSKLIMNPYSVYDILTADNTTVSVDDLNPISYIFQKETMTSLGHGGRSIDTMVKKSRERHLSDIGVISEGTVDDSNAGVNVTLSANSNIDNIFGLKGNDKLNNGNMFSTSVLLSPFATNDTGKRMNFISIQNKHMVPTRGSVVLPVRTGYETVILDKLDKKFGINAIMDGEVLSVTKTNITIEYKDKTKHKYSLSSWTSKEDSGGAYRHTLKTLLSKGDKFKAGDNIYYDDVFFGKDIFNTKGVAFKMGKLVNCGLIEAPETYEDSTAISKRLTSQFNVVVDKVKGFRLPINENITDIVNVGDTVDTTTPLFTMGGDGETSKLDKETSKLLQSMSRVSPKAKINGVITNIVVYYNAELKELSPGLKRLAKASDGRLNDKYGSDINGRVTNIFSVRGNSLLEGEVYIKFYIGHDINLIAGDKLTIGNQLKCTVGDVYSDIITTENGEEVDLLFSARSIEARIVNSFKLNGSLSTVLKQGTKEVLEIYYGKGK